MSKIAPITIFIGPMFSEKSASLLNRISSAQRAGKKVLAIKPQKDTRDRSKIISNVFNPETGQFIERAYPALLINDNDPQEMIECIKESRFDIFVADEIQFFGNWFVDLVRDLAWHEDNLIGGWASWRRGRPRDTWEGKEVVLAGLDYDFFRKDFGIAPKLINMADEVYKLKADCFVEKCDKKARFTQLIIDPKDLPAGFNKENPVFPGGKGRYQSRCGDHWFLPKGF